MDLGLAGKVALVAASSKGLGLAAARALSSEGARVMVFSRDPESVAAAVRQLEQAGGEVAGQTGDVTNAADNAAVVEATVQRWGGLDILVTNAGGPPSGTFDTTSKADWHRAFNLTLLSAVDLIKQALPHLRKSDAPSILTITSISAKQPISGLLLSNAIRPAVLGLTKTLAQELGPEGIRANSVLPGWTRTARVDQLLADRARDNGSSVEAEEQKIVEAVPLGRMARPDEFGRVVAFLCSPAASYITGVMLLVDGGNYHGLL